MMPSVSGLEAVLYAAWPPVVEEDDGGWVRRVGEGFSRRLNSVTVTDAAAVDDLDGRIGAAAAWLEERGAAPLMRVLSNAPAEVGTRLAGLDFATEGETLVMARVGIGFDEVGDVELAPRPSPEWLRAQEEWSGIREPSAWRAVLGRISPPVAHALATEAGEVAAVGLGVVRQGWLALFEIATHPQRRRRGHARRLVEALGRWAHGRGAGGATLQVQADNLSAVALYRSMGFRVVYSYRYWRDSGPRGEGLT